MGQGTEDTASKKLTSSADSSESTERCQGPHEHENRILPSPAFKCELIPGWGTMITALVKTCLNWVWTPEHRISEITHVNVLGH